DQGVHEKWRAADAHQTAFCGPACRETLLVDLLMLLPRRTSAPHRRRLRSTGDTEPLNALSSRIHLNKE
ncbi:hypothetical protein, partial [Ensifer sp. 22564]|uniref:hypothetical protein n=1 Tax=Ensifer sp. 22564 TaxID=3453943 RepID=UPI003F8663BA